MRRQIAPLLAALLPAVFFIDIDHLRSNVGFALLAYAALLLCFARPWTRLQFAALVGYLGCLLLMRDDHGIQWVMATIQMVCLGLHHYFSSVAEERERERERLQHRERLVVDSRRQPTGEGSL